MFNFRRWATVAIALAAMLRGQSAIGSPASVFTLLHSFSGPDGIQPFSVPVLDANGNLYGTTVDGGASTACQGGCGTVFSLKTDGTGYKILHSFSGADGASPYAGLILDTNGILYGTAGQGGNAGCGEGCGTIFKIKTDGTGFKAIYAFTESGADSAVPQAGLVLDANSYLYGTAVDGLGTIFKVKTDGTGYTVLHTFSGQADGSYPNAGVILDANGHLYGVTENGAHKGGLCDNYGCGTVYSLKTDGTGFRELHTFVGTDGAGASADLLLDGGGNLYGTTYGGGPSSACGTDGCGTAFSVKTDGTQFRTLHFFSGPDGANPESSLVLDANGNLYGTAVEGGNTACESGCGTVFRISASGAEYKVLYAFSGTDGNHPDVGLILGADGNLYSTTEEGGASTNCGTYGCGTVYKLATLGRWDASEIAASSPGRISGRTH